MYYQQQIHTRVPFSNEILPHANVRSKTLTQPIIAKMQFEINSFINVWLNKKIKSSTMPTKRKRNLGKRLKR